MTNEGVFYNCTATEKEINKKDKDKSYNLNINQLSKLETKTFTYDPDTKKVAETKLIIDSNGDINLIGSYYGILGNKGLIQLKLDKNFNEIFVKATSPSNFLENVSSDMEFTPTKSKPKYTREPLRPIELKNGNILCIFESTKAITYYNRDANGNVINFLKYDVCGDIFMAEITPKGKVLAPQVVYKDYPVPVSNEKSFLIIHTDSKVTLLYYEYNDKKEIKSSGNDINNYMYTQTTYDLKNHSLNRKLSFADNKKEVIMFSFSEAQKLKENKYVIMGYKNFQSSKKEA